MDGSGLATVRQSPLSGKAEQLTKAESVEGTEIFVSRGISVAFEDALRLYATWERPTVIISDGPYGVKGFPGDPPIPDTLPILYEPHIAAWSRLSSPATTLWFWGVEIGWAKVHPVLEKYGWTYRGSHVWDKGMGHVAGNVNTQSLRRFPPVTEICVQYTRDAEFPFKGKTLSMKEWLRSEWLRTGIPLDRTNEACGVKNAATRKYFTQDWLWYYPPVEIFHRLVQYANAHGVPGGRPYFSLDGQKPVTPEEWRRMRAKFHLELGVTNVWREPPLHNHERLKSGNRSVHLNQKPLKLMERIIRASSDEGDVVWDPFGGLMTAALAAFRLKRRCYSAESNPAFYKLGITRLRHEMRQANAHPLEHFSRPPLKNIS